MFSDAAVAILAGGSGTRLGGVNKALLEVKGRPVLAWQLEVLRWSFREILIVAPDPKPYAHLGLKVVPDAIPGRGAPGGLHAALSAARADWVFCLGCDMPWISERAIELLGSLRRDVDAVVPERGGRLEPLFAFYSKRCVAPFEAKLRAGGPSFRALLEGLEVRRVSEPELAAVDPGLKSLQGINTPEDLANARG
ncbi:MAG: molybdenum cofactor guanylyltransferase [Myxococcales bacterium]